MTTAWKNGSPSERTTNRSTKPSTSRAESVTTMLDVIIGASIRALEGNVSGDAFAAFEGPSGPMIALSDGLGHGPRAAEASDIFLRSVRENASEPLAVLFVRAHHALVRSRGAVAAVA